jgi:hypothetical protein
MKTTEYAERLEALKAHLIECGEFTEEETEELTYREAWDSFTAWGQEYKVLTDEEADATTREYILDTLWAFNAHFILRHTAFYDTSSIEDDEAFEEAIKELQGRICEGVNPIIRALIENIDVFVDDAIQADGRGHFLATYDGEEIELNHGKYYAYRMN